MTRRTITKVYETVTCLACTRVHLIKRATGKVAGGNDEKAAIPHNHGEVGKRVNTRK